MRFKEKQKLMSHIIEGGCNYECTNIEHSIRNDGIFY